MRHRETTYSTFDEAQALDYGYISSGSIANTDHTMGGVYAFKSIDDVETPDYRHLLKCGQFLPLNPLNITNTRTEAPVAHFNLHSAMHDFFIRGTYANLEGVPNLLTIPPVDETIIESVVLASAQNASAAPLDLLTEIFQAREDMALMEHIAHAFNSKASDLAKFARRVSRHPWKEFQNLWLEARFGVRPMMYLFSDAAKAYWRSLEKHEFTRGKGYHTVDLSGSAFRTGLDSFYSYGRLDESLSGTRTYRAASYVDSSGGTNSVGIDPFVTAWELTRFSFVVDWFVNVSAWVATVRPRLLGEFLGAQYSIKDEYTYARTFGYTGLKDDYGGTYEPITTTKTFSSYTRSPASVTLPPLAPYLDPLKFVDLAALFLDGRNAVWRILSK